MATVKSGSSPAKALSIHIPNAQPIDYSNMFAGNETQVPVMKGGLVRYINLDNGNKAECYFILLGASTPAFKVVTDAIHQYMPYYSSVHRGSGFKSQLSTWLFEEARHAIMDFVGANPQEYTCLFGKNATEAANKLARRFPFTEDRDIALVTGMEHHSSDLPWRANAPKVIHIQVGRDGRLDMEDLDAKLEKYANRIAIVSITGASNVTGLMNPVHEIAVKVHAIGAQIYVDCAQLIAHRSIRMLPLSDPAHIDYISLSGHKMYAPFGTGALIGRKDTFKYGAPDMPGGGTVQVVMLDQVMWANGPDRDEAGSPNTVGAVALLAAVRKLQDIGMDKVAQHESELTAYALKRLKTIPGIVLYGSDDPDNVEQRVGSIPFTLQHVPYGKVAAILGNEFGIGVRAGCFCAQPYVLHMIGGSRTWAEGIMDDIKQGIYTTKPGIVRASFGLYNTTKDVDALFYALQIISENRYKGVYEQDAATGDYEPVGWTTDYNQFYSIDKIVAESQAVVEKADSIVDSAYHSVSEASSPEEEPSEQSEPSTPVRPRSQPLVRRSSLDSVPRINTDAPDVKESKRRHRMTTSHTLDWTLYQDSSLPLSPLSMASMPELNKSSTLDRTIKDTLDKKKVQRRTFGWFSHTRKNENTIKVLIQEQTNDQGSHLVNTPKEAVLVISSTPDSDKITKTKTKFATLLRRK